jgi:hypothetical protein
LKTLDGRVAEGVVGHCVRLFEMHF